MAFTGTATIKKISGNLFRITGLSLAGAASGTISLAAGAGDVKLDGTGWGPYKMNQLQGGDVSLSDAVKVDVNALTANGEVPAAVKAGADPESFLVTVTAASGDGTGALEIYVGYHT